MVEYNADGVEMPDFDQEVISSWLEEVCKSFNLQVGELCYIFCDDAYILKINNDYLKHDYYTDVITFDYCENNIVSGDMFISLDTVRSNALQYEVDFNLELLRVVVHGVLHLCGLKDKNDVDASIMRKAENEALDLLKK